MKFGINLRKIKNTSVYTNIDQSCCSIVTSADMLILLFTTQPLSLISKLNICCIYMYSVVKICTTKSAQLL